VNIEFRNIFIIIYINNLYDNLIGALHKGHHYFKEGKGKGFAKRIFIDWQNDFSVRFSMFRKYLFHEKYFKSYPGVL
jgi:hypothetical protein